MHPLIVFSEQFSAFQDLILDHLYCEPSRIPPGLFETVTGSANTRIVLVPFTVSLNHPWPVATRSDHCEEAQE